MSGFLRFCRSFISQLKQGQSPLLAILLLAHVLFALVLLLRAGGYLETPELRVYDQLRSIQSRQQAPDDRITLIWMTDEDQRRFGWPISDKLLVQLLDTLLQHQPRAVGLDWYRDSAVPVGNQDAFPALLARLREHPEIVGIFKFQENDDPYVRVDVLPQLMENHQAGFNDFVSDPPDSNIRRGLLFMSDAEGHYEYFGLKLADHYLRPQGMGLRGGSDGQPWLGKVNLLHALPPLTEGFGAYVNADFGGTQFLASYPSAPAGFRSFTLTRLLNGDYDPAWIKNKIIIIGTAAEATPDFFLTPVQERLPGVSLHAYNTSQLLRVALGETQALRSWQESAEIAWIWLWCMLGALSSLGAAKLGRFLLINIAGLSGLSLCVFVAFGEYWWLLWFAPALAWVLSASFGSAYLAYHERHARRDLMNLFGRHVSHKVAEMIWVSRYQYLRSGYLQPQRLVASVLFTDLKDFTSISENMEPQVLMTLLNEYMEVMVHVVEQHQGQVNKFIGDAIMAVFGVPVASTSPEAIARDAENALNCALAMREALLDLQNQWDARGLPVLRMRVGIYTGPLVAGTLGGRERQEYTVLGDTVNTASRLEGYDKSLEPHNPCRILIGDATLAYLGERFLTRRVGTVKLKGKVTPITIYLVQGRKTALPSHPTGFSPSISA